MSSRAEFSQPTKDVLAARVGWKCSFPNCHIPTIGPSMDDQAKFVNLGEAAHIYAAAPNGPRSNPNLTPEQRSSISNAIWLCRHHARLIDRDPLLYSAETLLKFKESAEELAQRQLRDLLKDEPEQFLTYIAISNILFTGSWISADEDIWSFRIADFIHGNITSLQKLSINFEQIPPWEKFIAIESQGDGRPLEKFSWKVNDKGQFIVVCKVGPKPPRRDPNSVGEDIGFDVETGDLIFEDGDFVLVTGKEAALQCLQLMLSSPPGIWLQFPTIGSHLPAYCQMYANRPQLLSQLVKMEIIRLMSVVYQVGEDNPAPELSFINRVIQANVKEISMDTGIIRLNVEIEFGNFEHWKGDLTLKIRL